MLKYETLAEATVRHLDWTKVEPIAPEFLFVPRDAFLAESYERFWSVPQIFAPSGDPAPGIVTTHDQFAISFTPEEARAKVRSFLKARDEEEARGAFRLCSQSQWSYANARDALPKLNLAKLTVPLLYRPFDVRWTIWDAHVAVHRRERVMQHMLRDNIGLITTRMTKGEDFRHVQVTDKVCEVICISPVTSNNGFLFPLYIYAPKGGGHRPKGDLFGTNDEFSGKARIENIAPEFRKWIDEKYQHRYSPEELLGYIYAVLHAPAYRTKYGEFLRRGFPRIPFPEKRADFDALANLGWELVEVHLLREGPQSRLETYTGKGNDEVEKVRYLEDEQAAYINPTQKFEAIRPQVWDFQIGGYQVLDKYLRSRRGRKLSLDEIQNVESIVTVLAFTISQMSLIDRALLRWLG